MLELELKMYPLVQVLTACVPQATPFQVVPAGQLAHAFWDCWKKPELQVHETPLKYEFAGQVGRTELLTTHCPLVSWNPVLQTHATEL